MKPAGPSTNDGGGCLCSAVRFSVAAEPLWSAYCHCESCRRATGSPRRRIRWICRRCRALQRWREATFSSSSGVERSYCGNCGTPLSYRSTRWPGEIHLYTPTFDNPAAYPPTFHVHWAEKLAWLGVMDSLPKYDHASIPADTPA